jgi:hypothetical protein
MLILHGYALLGQEQAKSGRTEEQQAETWEALRAIRQKFSVVDKALEGPEGYDDFLLEYWGKDDLIIVEQDIVPSLAQVESMIHCSEPWCAYRYQFHYIELPNKPKLQPYYLATGFGFTKIALNVQTVIPSSSWYKKGDWRDLDSRVVDRIIKAGFSQHLHGEVKHNRVVNPWVC